MLAPIDVRAEVNGCSSIEALCVESDNILAAHLAAPEKYAQEQGDKQIDLQFTVDEVIKGSDNPGKGGQAGFRTLIWGDVARKAVLKGDPVLIFRLRDKVSDPMGPYGFVFIPLREVPAAYNLVIADRFQNVLRDGEAILKLTREWSRSPVKHTLSIEVTSDDLERILYMGSADYIVVPAEERWRSILIEKASSPNAYDRSGAISELYKFPDDETRAIVIAALNDPSFSERYDSPDVLKKYSYPVREAAMRSLAKLDSDWSRPATEAERLEFRKSTWAKTFSRVCEGLSGWSFVSVEDGDSVEMKQDNPKAEPVRRYCQKITLKSPDGPCSVVIVPKEFTQDYQVPGHKLLGPDTSYNAPTFIYLSEGFPPAGAERIQQFFGVKGE